MNSVKESFNKFLLGRWIFLFLFLVSLANGRTISRKSSLARRTIFSEPTKPIPGPEKNYTGIRVKHDSLLLLYYHEQTVAVVEVAPNRALFNCELLEVNNCEGCFSKQKEPKTKADKRVALNSLKPIIPTQIRIAFSDMIDLMTQCQKLDSPLNLEKEFVNEGVKNVSNANSRQFTSIFSGVFPGTKWCGTGDIAASYHDLGSDKELDKCCRTHDLCPVKVAGLKTQYNLTNYAIYTKSHCVCDDYFYNCLKSVGTAVSNFVGSIYFNVAPVTCVEDVPHETQGFKPKKQFTIKNKRY